jgi:ribonuclease P protein component
MKSDRYLTKPRQYDSVHVRGRALTEGPVAMKSIRNGLQCSRYGLSVGRRVGKAVTRNKVKRRMREVMRKKVLVPGWDIVLIGRSSAAHTPYAALDRSIGNLLARGGVLATR